MSYAPRSVFTGTGLNGKSFTIYEWDFKTYAQMQMTINLVTLVVFLTICPFVAPLMLIKAIYKYSGVSKLMYIVGMLISGYVWYDFTHGWLMLSAVNIMLDESTITFLLGLNKAVFVIFGIFLFLGQNLYAFVERSIGEQVGRWALFLAIIGVIGVFVVTSTTASSKYSTGWIMKTLQAESESDRQDRLDQEQRDRLGDFNSEQERTKHFDDMQRRYGN